MNRLLFISILLVLIVVPAIAILSWKRIEAHARWEAQEREAFQFEDHMWSAASLVHFAVSDPIRLQWLGDELYYSESTIYNLGYTDADHFVQLGLMSDSVERLRSNLTPYLKSLNSSQLDTLTSLLHSIGAKFLAAYSNYINYTSTGPYGPDFWYNGPTPPDDALLQQSISLMATTPGLPSLPTG